MYNLGGGFPGDFGAAPPQGAEKSGRDPGMVGNGARQQVDRAHTCGDMQGSSVKMGAAM